MDVAALAKLSFFALVILAGLSSIGWPIQLLLRHLGVPRAVLSLPLIGLGVVELTFWYWTSSGYVIGHLGIVLSAAGIATGALMTLLQRGHRTLAGAAHRLSKGIALPFVLFIAVLTLMVSQQGTQFRGGSQTVSSLFNIDAPSYVLQAQTLVDNGFRDPHSIVGFDAGARNRLFGFGSYALIAFGASVNDRDAWQIAEASMLAALFLAASSTVRLIRLLGPTKRATVSLIAATCGCSVFLLWYLVGQFFFGQIIGMAVVPALGALLLTAAVAERWRTRVGLACAAWLISVAGIVIYAPMFGAGTAVLLPGLLLAIGPRKWIKRSAAALGTLAAGVALSYATAPKLVGDALRTSRQLANAQAGWPHNYFLPSDILGFQTTIAPSRSTGIWVVNGIGTLALVGALIVVHHLGARRFVRFAAPTLVMIALSYVAVYHHEHGPSYRQWKWITFFVPLSVALVVATLLHLVWFLATRWPLARDLGLGAVGLYLVLTTSLADLVVMPGTNYPGRYLRVTPELVNLAVNPVLRDLDELNVQVGTSWEEMWAAYFLRNKRLYLLSSSYYPVSQPAAEWTLERADSPAPASREVIVVNASYELVHTATG